MFQVPRSKTWSVADLNICGTSVLDISTGKSCLFTCSVTDLLTRLKNHPLDVQVMSKDSSTVFGKTGVYWNENFFELVKGCGKLTNNNATPATLREAFYLRDDEGKTVGKINLFVGLSCYGKGIQTQFRIVKEVKNGVTRSRFLFKNSNATTTFECER